MKSNAYQVIKYEADDGKVFDWVNLEEHIDEIEEDGKISQVQQHLYAKVIWIGHLDSIENYVEVDAPEAE